MKEDQIINDCLKGLTLEVKGKVYTVHRAGRVNPMLGKMIWVMFNGEMRPSLCYTTEDVYDSLVAGQKRKYYLRRSKGILWSLELLCPEIGQDILEEV